MCIRDSHRTALRSITITADDGEVKVYQVPYSIGLKIENGKRVEKGQPITDGALYPQDVLRISGVEAVQDYLVQSVQAVYRQQGVDINDKHIEVIIRQMMRKVKIEDSGDTDLLVGTTVDSFEFEDANAAIQARIDAGETDLRLAQCSMAVSYTHLALFGAGLQRRKNRQDQIFWAGQVDSNEVPAVVIAIAHPHACRELLQEPVQQCVCPLGVCDGEVCRCARCV